MITKRKLKSKNNEIISRNKFSNLSLNPIMTLSFKLVSVSLSSVPTSGEKVLYLMDLLDGGRLG